MENIQKMLVKRKDYHIANWRTVGVLRFYRDQNKVICLNLAHIHYPLTYNQYPRVNAGHTTLFVFIIRKTKYKGTVSLFFLLSAKIQPREKCIPWSECSILAELRVKTLKLIRSVNTNNLQTKLLFAFKNIRLSIKLKLYRQFTPIYLNTIVYELLHLN